MATTVEANGPARAVAGALADAPDIRGFEIPRPKILQATVHIVGLSPLIAHRWTEKAMKMMEDAQTGKAKGMKEKRNPEQEAWDAAYVVPGREDLPNGEEGKYCFPAPAFKHAFLYGVSQVDDVKKFPKTRATAWVFIDSDPVIQYESISLRTDTGRIGQGTATMIYRPQFNGWGVDLDISYNSAAITLDQIVALFDLGGTGGVGEWRPTSPKNKSGDFGRFYVSGLTERQ